jgi:aspartate aminotransferase-like enzyme/GNAT superfamily N-acetyltransferase
MPDRMTVKLADSAAEYDQIHRLNYQTFVEEVGQYSGDGSGMLIDKFHDKSLYWIAVKDGRVAGMIATHDQPPFSIEARLGNGALKSLGGPLLEIRLLAVHPDYRPGLFLTRIFVEIFEHARRKGYSHMIISGITSQASMYERLGFRALGPAVPSGAASFIPMALPLRDLPERSSRAAAAYSGRRDRLTPRPPISLMPGPVELPEVVRRALSERPVSHRSREFVECYESARARLAALSGNPNVVIFSGSGTTANDSVALHLKAAFEDRLGLILANGEFGERLGRQAQRAGLHFNLLRWRWGDRWDLNRIEAALKSRPAWVWAVHLETSTGVLNQVHDLTSLASSENVPVALDCVSSLGAVPLPAAGVWMSTGVSGKAIGTLAGLSFLFPSAEALRQLSGTELLASLDSGAAVNTVGPRFTVASPTVFALGAALNLYYRDAEHIRERFAHYQRLGQFVRSELRNRGLEPLACECDSAPTITTFLPQSGDFVERCRRRGFELAADSEYLRNRGWAQIATMGAVRRSDLAELFAGIGRTGARIPPAAAYPEPELGLHL